MFPTNPNTTVLMFNLTGISEIFGSINKYSKILSNLIQSEKSNSKDYGKKYSVTINAHT